MGLHGAFGDIELVGDHLVGIAARHAFEHLQLLAGERGEHVGKVLRLAARDGAFFAGAGPGTDDVRRQVDGAGQHLLQGLDHLLAGGGLGNKPDRAVGDGLQDHPFLFLGGDDHRRQGGKQIAQPHQAAEALHAGHIEVQQHQIQVVVTAGHRQGGVQVGRLQQRAAGEAIVDHPGDGLAEQGMVVGDQHLVHGYRLVGILIRLITPNLPRPGAPRRHCGVNIRLKS